MLKKDIRYHFKMFFYPETKEKQFFISKKADGIALMQKLKPFFLIVLGE